MISSAQARRPDQPPDPLSRAIAPTICLGSISARSSSCVRRDCHSPSSSESLAARPNIPLWLPSRLPFEFFGAYSTRTWPTNTLLTRNQIGYAVINVDAAKELTQPQIIPCSLCAPSPLGRLRNIVEPNHPKIVANLQVGKLKTFNDSKATTSPSSRL